MYTIPYLLIKARLTNRLPELKIISWYTGQDLLDKQGNPVYRTPAAFIEFAPVDTTQKGLKVQRANMTFMIHLLTLNLRNADQRIAGDGLAVNHSSLMDKLFKHLSHYTADLSDVPGLEPEKDARVLNSVRRTGVSLDHSLRKLMKSTSTFQAAVSDYSAVISYERLEGDVALEQQLNMR